MQITASLFEAFLKCPTKFWLRATNEQPSGNDYAEWVKARNESYRIAETERLRVQAEPDDVALSPLVESFKTAKWRLAVDVVARASSPASSGSVSLPEQTPGATPDQLADGTSALPGGVVGTDSTPSQEFEGRGWNASLPAILESHLHAVERVPSEGRGKAAQFIPIRFIFFNKLTKDDKLLLDFDAFVLSTGLRREIATGKIMHGDVRSCARESAAKVSGKAGFRMRQKLRPLRREAGQSSQTGNSEPRSSKGARIMRVCLRLRMGGSVDILEVFAQCRQRRTNHPIATAGDRPP